MKSYKVLLSTLGRSHYVVAAERLVAHGVDLTLLQGWVPSMDSWLLKVIVKIIKRKSFIVGMGKRHIAALHNRSISEPLGEFVQKGLFMTIGRLGDMGHHISAKIGFWIHGFCTRRHLRGIDILHVKSGLGRGGAIAAAHRWGVKVVVDHCVPHPYSMKASTGEKGYVEWWSYWNSVMADCCEGDVVMVGSQYIKDTFVEQGFPPEKIAVVPLGILPYFNHAKTKYLKSGCLRLVYSGAWQHWKGVDDLIDAVEMLNDKLDFRLTVLGGYSESNSAYLKAKRLNLPVDFVGHVPQENLRDYMAQSDVFVFPSLRDGFAISAVEGMAAGVCLVTTRESSIPVVDGETGFVVNTHSPKEISDKILFLNANRDIVERVGRAGADYVSNNFTWDKYAENVMRVYQALIDNR